MRKKQVGIVIVVLIFLVSVGQSFSEEKKGKVEASGKTEKVGKSQPIVLPAKVPFSLIVTGGDTLRAKIQKVQLWEVLEELASQTGLSMEIDQVVGRELISAEFDPMPLEEGIQNLLRNKNYILTYTEIPSTDGSVSTLRVDGIKVSGVSGISGKIDASSLHRLREENMTNEIVPMPTGQEEALRLSQDKAAVSDQIRKETSGIIHPFLVPARPMNPNTVPASPGNTTLGVIPATKGGNTTGNISSGNSEAGQNANSEDDEDYPSIASLTNTVTTNPDRDARLDAMEDLAYEGGLGIIPTLQQVARSDADSEIRTRAQELIEEIKEEAAFDQE